MNADLSPNTQAILLLTAPLKVGRHGTRAPLLTPSEYSRLARYLRDAKQEPADLLFSRADEVLDGCRPIVDKDRARSLLGRGFLLSQAIERWGARAIWVISRADPDYPQRLKRVMRDTAPAVLYGCGERAILGTGGLAVVGSRHVDQALVEYTEGIGRLAAEARQTVVSGGARGIDQAAMRGALVAGGKVVGVMANGLERAAMSRDNRESLMGGGLVLVSPYDPGAGFNVGNAMQRNKLIYAFSDAALVVNADRNKGGTWAGATEQLGKLHFVPVYVRSTGTATEGLTELQKKGALPWPNPETPAGLMDALNQEPTASSRTFAQTELPLLGGGHPSMDVSAKGVPQPGEVTDSPSRLGKSCPTDTAEALFGKVRELLMQILVQPKREGDVASVLEVTPSQARMWLTRLADEGVVERRKKPVTYVVKDGVPGPSTTK